MDETRIIAKKKENILQNIGFNVIIPSIVMMQMSSEDRLGPLFSLLVAMIFPLSYGAWDMQRRRRFNFLSIIGVAAVVLTGVVGLLRLNADWLAAKEALVPMVIALAILISQRTRYPLFRSLLNEAMDIDMIDRAFASRGHAHIFESQMTKAAYAICSMFIVSACINYALARFIVRSAPGTPEFTAELGNMTLLTYPLIVVPSFAVLILVFGYLIRSIQKNTDLDTDSIFRL